MSAYQHSSPPRYQNLWSRLIILNSGWMPIIGWAMLGFGMIFFWVFVMQSEILFWGESHDWKRTEGTISRIRSTNASQNSDLIYQIEFNYELAETVYSGIGYTSGLWVEEGQHIPVEYAIGQPEVSRSPDLRREMFSAGAALVGILPLVALGFLFFGFRKNMKDLHLIQAGHFAQGKLKNKRPTNTTINHRRVYAFTFEFQAKNGRTYEVEGRTHKPEILEDEALEKVLYLADQPEKATLFDTIAVAPQLLLDGRLAPVNPLQAWVLIFPLVTLLGHGVYALVRYNLW